jgi:hypothetical protein
MKHLPLFALPLVLLAGCSYYEITDPSTGRMYYTTNWDDKRHNATGVYDFTDKKTGARVVLQQSEARPISKSEYDQALGEK